MRLANLRGRAVLLGDGTALDVASASGGRFGPEPRAALDEWDEFRAWADTADLARGDAYSETELGAPIPDPRQIFAIGLNYTDHADESGLAYPEHLIVFTKFLSSLSGPRTAVSLSSDRVDYEAELVVTIGREVRDIAEEEAVGAIAGYSVGQDFSDRGVQLRPPAPQFSLGKSFPGFGPFGPAIVTADEVDDPAAFPISCVITGPTATAAGHDEWTVQDGNSRDMIFSVARIVSDLSRVVTLYPGDVIFTGTPAGVGGARGISLQAGDVVTTSIAGLGTIRSEFV